MNEARVGLIGEVAQARAQLGMSVKVVLDGQSVNGVRRHPHGVGRVGVDRRDVARISPDLPRRSQIVGQPEVRDTVRNVHRVLALA